MISVRGMKKKAIRKNAQDSLIILWFHLFGKIGKKQDD